MSPAPDEIAEADAPAPTQSMAEAIQEVETLWMMLEFVAAGVPQSIPFSTPENARKLAKALCLVLAGAKALQMARLGQ